MMIIPIYIYNDCYNDDDTDYNDDDTNNLIIAKTYNNDMRIIIVSYYNQKNQYELAFLEVEISYRIASVCGVNGSKSSMVIL